MSNNEPPVLIGDVEGVRTITLNRPEVLNACNKELLVALGKAVREAEKDATVRCVVLTGAGRAFCSGQDLADVADRYKSPEPIELGAHLRDYYNPIALKIRTMEKPIIAAVNGAAAGAGASLALICDLRIAAESAGFIQSFVFVGLMPDCGSSFMLPRLVGMGRALELAFTGRKVKAGEALQMGMVNRVVPDNQLASATTELAGKLASLPTTGIGLTKRAINRAWSADLEDQLGYESMLQTTAGRTEDHHEGVNAFMEKRPPQFKGQ